MELIREQHKKYHVSMDTVKEFELAIMSDPRISCSPKYSRYISELLYYLWIIFDKAGLLKSRVIPTKVYEKLINQGARDYFVVMMALDKLKCMPYFLFPGRKSIYLFDAWPSIQDKIIHFINCAEIEHAFLSSSEAIRRLSKSVKNCSFHWVPEGINPLEYKQCPYSEKNIDVLHLGRRFDTYHELIVNPLANDQKVYVYKKSDKELIFPTRGEFIDGLARSKISICVPCNMTHPKRSGDIETMTIRYLQSMVSKCLIIGHAPEEMISLFGYNPVIEIDMCDPVGQLRHVLNSFNEYIPLIEENFAAITEKHTWQRRWESIAHVLLMER